MQKQYFYKIFIKESEKNISQLNTKKSFTVTSSKHSVTRLRKKESLHSILLTKDNILMGGMFLSPIFLIPKNKVLKFHHFRIKP